MMLRVLSGPQSGAELALSEQPLLAGSDEARCDIVLFGGGVAPAHCMLQAVGAAVVLQVPEEGAAVELNGQPVPAGEHDVEVPAHLKLASVDLLLHWVQPQAAPAEEAAAAQRPAASPRRRRAVRWTASALFVGGITAFMSGAMGWFDKPEPAEISRAQRVLAELGHRDLAVAYDVEGLLTVTGYVRSREEAEQVRKAFREFPGKAVAVRLAVAGAATQIDRGAGAAAQQQRLGGGSVLVEPKPLAPEVASSGEAPLALKVRALKSGEGGYLETSSGMRYFVGSQLPGGYTLKAVGDNSITLLRGETETEVSLRP